MDREDLDRQMAEKENTAPRHTGSARTKKFLAAAAVLLIVGGGLGGYYFRDFSFGKSSVGETYKLPEAGEPKNFDLPAVRNTAIVQAVREVGPSVVGITTKVYDRDLFNRRVEVGTSVGSGVLFDKKGYLVTNAHVVGDAKKVNVSLTDGKTVEGTVVGKDTSTDLAVVKIEGNENLPVASFGDSDKLQVGETAIAIGNPLGLEFQGSVTVGVISALNRTLDDMDQRFRLIQTDAAINPGNSGGALVTADGLVVGINSAKIAKTGVEGMGFAIPINQARGIIESLISEGKVTRAYLGFYGADKDIAERYGYTWPEDAKGVMVMRISGNSPISLTDIRPGDFITALAGKSFSTMRELREILDAHRPGETVSLTYTHDGKEHTIDIMLAAAKADDE